MRGGRIWLGSLVLAQKSSACGVKMCGIKKCKCECGGRAQNKKTRDKALNQKHKIINLNFKINTKFQHLKIRAEFKIVKNNQNF